MHTKVQCSMNRSPAKRVCVCMYVGVGVWEGVGDYMHAPLREYLVPMCSVLLLLSNLYCTRSLKLGRLPNGGRGLS